ncbi:MAG: hypothetical protein EZS28_011818 [Streblomastix strix]|uniref:Uncharacterized protein n=1 Tax=Streblomastix strix TaxID=222440 RepID=A0A5J4WCJ0_9EUKA|nr:MAG: hypothetical protein EZS28_011818 [Streblomastix strix]
MDLITNDKKRDAHIYKLSGVSLPDSTQYFKIAFQGSKSNQPLSVFFEIDEDQEQGYFSLSTITGECWDTSLGLELFPGCICQPLGQPSGCICTSTVHPTDCTCPPDDPNYQQDKCDFYKLPTCSGVSDPGQCRCSASNYPLDCLCPLDDLDTTYTQTLCLAERQYAQLPLCISDTTTPTGGCKCTSDNHPTDCTCPIDFPDYTLEQCSEDIQPVIPQQCSSIISTTPEVDCACPTDAAKLELDPRKDTICKPSTGKEASGSIRAFLSLIVAVVLIPSLALIF